MKSEYILYDNSKLEEILKLQYENVTIKEEKIVKSKNSLISFVINDDNEESARILSKIDQAITSKFKVEMIKNEGLEYIHGILFKLINQFELNIRKLLYLLNEKNDNNKLERFKNQIEDKTFDEIFKFLFIDESFNKNITEKINRGNLNKSELLKIISDIEEKPFWSKVFPKYNNCFLQNHYNELRNYRNDIMHAHNISWETSKKIIDIYSRANGELTFICLSLVEGNIFFDINEICKGINAFIESESFQKITESIKAFVEWCEPKAKNFTHILNNIVGIFMDEK